MRLFNTAILSVISLVLCLMPLSPASALNLDSTYLAQAGYWTCSQIQSCMPMQTGTGASESEARADLNRNIQNYPLPPGTPCSVIVETSCGFVPTGGRKTGGGKDNSSGNILPTPTTVPGNYRLSNGTIFFSNGSDAYCTYQSSEHIVLADMIDDGVIRDADSLPAFRNDKNCPVFLSDGAYRLVDGRIIASNGKAYCTYVSYKHYERKDGRPIRHLNDSIPLYAMQNHFNCAQ